MSIAQRLGWSQFLEELMGRVSFRKFLQGQIRSPLMCVYFNHCEERKRVHWLPLSWQQRLFPPLGTAGNKSIHLSKYEPQNSIM